MMRDVLLEEVKYGNERMKTSYKKCLGLLYTVLRQWDINRYRVVVVAERI